MALATGPIALVQPILVLELGFGEKVRTAAGSPVRTLVLC